MTIPSLFYKYRSFNALSERMLTHNELFLSSPRRFNDPLDCKLPPSYEKGTYEQIYNKNLEYLEITFPYLNSKERKIQAKRLSKEMYRNRNDQSRLKSFRQEIIKSLCDSYGIFSMSSSCNNKLMWSHYANSHSGFCVGLDGTKLFRFIDEYSFKHKVLLRIDKVLYQKEYPVINPYSMNEMEMFLSILLSKSTDWKYEQEYRLICAGHTDLKLIINPDLIATVLLGAMIERSNEEKMIKLLSNRSKRVLLFKGFYKEESFDLDFKKIEY